MTRSEARSKKQIRLVHICSSDITVKFLLQNQLEYFITKGFGVSAICSREQWFDSIVLEGLSLYDVQITRYFSPLKDFIALLNLIRLLARHKPDIIHTHTPKAALLGLTAAFICGIKYRCNTIHGFRFSPSTKGIKRHLLILLEKISGKLSHHTFCQNPLDTETALALRIVPRKKISTIGNGIDLKKFSLNNYNENIIGSFKNKLGIKNEDFVIGIVARLVKEKGYLELSGAFKSICPKFPSKLLIIGAPDKSKKDVLTIDVIKEGIPADKIIFIPYTDRIPDYLSIMDVFVLPSYREGFPRSVLEAEAMGLPVIAAKSSGALVAVENEKTGFLVPVRDWEQIAKYILLLRNNHELRKTLGRQARLKAEAEFNETIVFDKILAAYRNMIDN